MVRIHSIEKSTKVLNSFPHQNNDTMVYSWGETERGVDKRPNQIIRGEAAQMHYPYESSQNEDGFQPSGLGLVENARTIKAHAVRPYLREEQLRDVNKVTVAFLARAPHKFTEKLKDQSVDVRRDALGTMGKWLLAHPKNKEAQVAANAVPALTSLLSDADPTVRERAADVLALLVETRSGVSAALDCGAVPALILASRDLSSDATRRAAHACLQRVAACPEGAHAVVAAGGIAQLVAACGGGRDQPDPGPAGEPGPPAEAVLSLGCCLQDPDGLEQALLVGANATMVKLLDHPGPGVLRAACRNLALLATPIEAKVLPSLPPTVAFYLCLALDLSISPSLPRLPPPLSYLPSSLPHLLTLPLALSPRTSSPSPSPSPRFVRPFSLGTGDVLEGAGLFDTRTHIYICVCMNVCIYAQTYIYICAFIWRVRV